MKLISVKGICEFLNVNKSIVYVWIRMNKIPSYRINNIIRFDLDEITQWVKEQKTLPPNVYTLTGNVSENQDIDEIIEKAIDEARGKGYNRKHRGNQTKKARKGGA